MKILILWLCLLLTVYQLSAQTPLITYGSEWKYLDNGSDQGIAWRSPSFYDAPWNTGNGKFGYGLPELATIVSYGPDPNQKYITTYFRKSIFLENPAIFTSFTAGVLRDDGIVVYVNGVEVYRNNMPKGSFNYLTFGKDASDNGTVTQSFTINKSAFVSGNNVIAAEIHQKTVTNFDLAFDLQLFGEGALTDETPPYIQNILRQTPATEVTSASTLIFRATFSEKVTGVDKTDFTLTTVSGAVSGVLAEGAVVPVGTGGDTYDITASSIQGEGTLRLDLNESGTGITDTAGNAISTGFTNGETYIIQQGAPVITGINRLLPATEHTGLTTVTFRVVFSQKVRGVDASDFTITTLSGNVRGTLTTVAQEAASSSLTDAVSAAGPDSTGWNVTVTAIAGNGVLRLDLKENNHGITNTTGDMLISGFTSGQTYTISSSASQGFVSFQDIDPLSISTATRETPQAKVWSYAGKWWAVLPGSGGTKVMRLDGTVWTDVLTVANAGNSRADCRVLGNLVHILLFRGNSVAYFVSLEFDPVLNTYKRWTQRTSNVNINFEQGTNTATLAIDATGRAWIASNTQGNMLVRWSDPPYTTWSSPIAVATGATNNDICAITTLPGKVGILWSNQNTRLFGFKTHNNGDAPSVWSADEAPASQSALNVGDGLSDFQLNIVAAGDGTLYCAVKTAYDRVGYPTLALLVRRPDNTWDDLYPVTSSKEGNRPFVILNEAAGKIKVFYTTHLINFDGTRTGDILYRESSTAAIAFGPPVTLLSGKGINSLIYTTSTHQTYNPEILVLTTNESTNPNTAVGILATDETLPGMLTTSPASPTLSVKALYQEMTEHNGKGKWLARPNPFTSSITLDFILSRSGRYSAALYDSEGRKVKVISRGWAEAGIRNIVSIDGSRLANGSYYIRVQTGQQIQTLKLLKK